VVESERAQFQQNHLKCVCAFNRAACILRLWSWNRSPSQINGDLEISCEIRLILTPILLRRTYGQWVGKFKAAKIVLNQQQTDSLLPNV
jgi:hypothetical protein